MGGKTGLIFLLILITFSACNARELVGSNLVTEETEVSFSGVLERVDRNKKVCLLCEEFTSQALDYLSQNKTQTEIIAVLHSSCSKLHSLKMECITLVDYYAPLFFLDISTIRAEDFCTNVDLCDKLAYYSKLMKKSSCGLCQLAVAEVVSKLKDPDTEMDILQLLLKECSALEKFLPKCKTMVFEYAPLIIGNTEQFLESSDICTMLHACDAPMVSTQAELIMENASSGHSSV